MDDVKVTIIGVERSMRQALKVACLQQGTSLSAELRDRLPHILDEIRGQSLTYNQLVRLLMGMIGVTNLALAGRDPEAHAAMNELSQDLAQFRRQIQGERRIPR